jgi:hypothetical protein
MPRFVVLQHEPGPKSARPLHWDLMLESGDILRTWALESVPSVGQPIAAQLLEDHRQDYLEYEGPVSDGRGSVCRWDAGHFTWLDADGDAVTVELQGTRLNCSLQLTRETKEPHQWTACFT